MALIKQIIMVNDKVLLNDGSSFVLLNDGASVVLLNSETGVVTRPEKGGGLMYGVRHKRRKRGLTGESMVLVDLLTSQHGYITTKSLIKNTFKGNQFIKSSILSSVKNGVTSKSLIRNKFLNIINKSVIIKRITRQEITQRGKISLVNIINEIKTRRTFIKKRIYSIRTTKADILDENDILDLLDEIDDE